MRTNTPLQALVTLNDPCFVEAAQGLARRAAAAGTTAADKLNFAFRACLTRPPTQSEVSRLTALYDAARKQYDADAKEAEAMATKPLGPAPKGADVKELAALTIVSNVLLNLDETVTKE